MGSQASLCMAWPEYTASPGQRRDACLSISMMSNLAWHLEEPMSGVGPAALSKGCFALRSSAMAELPESPAATVRRLMREADRATLATAAAGWPFASLVLAALDDVGEPLLLLSDLAEHAKNIKSEPRVSLLYDGTAGLDDPLTGPRVTVLGRARETTDTVRLDRFLARHPAAKLYAGFKDFRLYRIAVERAHLVAGFGKIHWVEAAELIAV